MFKNRLDAALQLVKKMRQFKGQDTIVFAIPRGGVPIGCTIAAELGVSVEVILSKKIGHPFNPEFAIGSVSLHGNIINDYAGVVSMEYINREIKRITKELKEKFKRYMGNKQPSDIKNKIAIIVDDGIATGNTLMATIDSIKKNNPKKIVVGVPVAPPRTIEKLKSKVDEFICLLSPTHFLGISQFYEDFSPVSDEEVVQLIQNNCKQQTMISPR